jgi:uncharacterized protein DUF5678
MPAMDKESAFADLIKDYENLWIAIVEQDGIESVVGAGKTAVEAISDAKAKGHPQAMLCKVPRFESRFISGITLAHVPV